MRSVPKMRSVPVTKSQQKTFFQTPEAHIKLGLHDLNTRS